MKYYNIWLLILLLFISSCSNDIAINKNISNINDRLNNYLELIYQDNQFPGIQYVVFNNKEILYEYSGGYAKIANKEEMTKDSVLNVFSTTKIITAIAILQLAQEGKLLLTDRAVKYFPDLPYKNVTIKQILSHSSGIKNALLGNFFIHWKEQHNEYDRNENLLSTLKNSTSLNFESGKEIGYTNMGYAILGRIIENITGLKYEEYITKNIFNKLNLDNKKINFNSQSQDKSSLPYFKSYSPKYYFMVQFLEGSNTKSEGDWTSINGPFYFNHPSHGGIIASASEYAKIFMDLMSGNKSDLLSPEFIKKMFSEQIKYKDTTMAVSWFMDSMENIPYFYHQGSGMGYVAEVRIYPEDNIGSIILMNRTDHDALLTLNILDTEFLSARRGK